MTPQRTVRLALFDARRALNMSQAQFGPAVGGSHRSAVRWDAGDSTPGAHHLTTLAALLYPHDRSLAAEFAGFAGQTLQSLQLEAPPPPPTVAAPPPPPVPVPPPVPALRHPKAEDLVDVVVLAAMLETGGRVDDVRQWLHVVMKRACDVGLSVEDAERALRPAVVPANE